MAPRTKLQAQKGSSSSKGSQPFAIGAARKRAQNDPLPIAKAKVAKVAGGAVSKKPRSRQTVVARSQQTVVVRQVEHFQRITEVVVSRSQVTSQPKPKKAAASKALKAPAKKVTAKKATAKK